MGEPASQKLVVTERVSYRDVDRLEKLSLPGVFRLLQEAAIRQADQFEAGTGAMQTRGESWVLNRMAVAVYRYPRYEETLRVETWSSGIKGFKGYRDFRVHDAQGQVVIGGSSLWLYVSLKTKSIVRVPREIVTAFPVHEGDLFCPDLESLEFVGPAEPVRAAEFALRYSDVDTNDHVNNAVYLDLVQSALARVGVCPRPATVRIKFSKAIPADAEVVSVRLDTTSAVRLRFSIEDRGVVFAVGEVGEKVRDGTAAL
jgi:acyl-ACP thioesterase